MQAFFLVTDDIMDGSHTRRGKDCWYKKSEIGMKAVNDFIFLETCIYTLLDKHFSTKEFYLHLLDAFLYVSAFIYHFCTMYISMQYHIWPYSFYRPQDTLPWGKPWI